jgi:hypothetical protein
VFDGNSSDTVILQSTGVIGGDAVAFTSTSAKFSNSLVGLNKTVAVSGISAAGADAFNYKLVSKSASTIATISP